MSAGIDRRVLAAEEVGEVELAQVLEERVAERVAALREDLDLRVGLQRAFDDLPQLLARAVRLRDEDAIDAELPADLLEVVGRTEHRDPTERASGELRVVVDESDHGRIGEGTSVQLERERHADVSRADDDGTHPVRLAGALSFQREQARLEANSTGTDEDQQRGDRRCAEEGEADTAQVRDPRQLEGRGKRSQRAGGEDAQRLVDRGVSPDGSVESDDLIDGELGDDGDQKVRQRAADAERDRAPESCGHGDEPPERDDADIEDAQARGPAALSHAVDGPCERLMRRRNPTRRLGRRESTHENAPSPRCAILRRRSLTPSRSPRLPDPGA